MLSEAIKFEVILNLILFDAAIEQHGVERVIGPADSFILKVELYPHNCRVALTDVSFKARQQRDENHDFKCLFFVMGLEYSFGQLFHH